MNIRHTPDTVAAPFGPYSHAVEVPEGSRLLYISGEVGVLPDGGQRTWPQPARPGQSISATPGPAQHRSSSMRWSCRPG